MPFKIVSTVHIEEHPKEGGKMVADHEIMTRVRDLKPGEEIFVDGSYNDDIEGKGPSYPVKVRLRVLDNNTLGVSHVKPLLEAMRSLVERESEYNNRSVWSYESRIPGNSRIELLDYYTLVSHYPEVFSYDEKREIEERVNKIQGVLKGWGNEVRETKLVWTTEES